MQVIDDQSNDLSVSFLGDAGFNEADFLIKHTHTMAMS